MNRVLSSVPHDMAQSARDLERELRLPEGFLESLEEEDDWSFIIKLHALLEGAISFLLTRHFGGNEALAKIMDRIELSNKETGKMAFVKALDLLIPEGQTFISKLSELRNKVVHNISEVGFDLSLYVQCLNKDQFNNFVQAFQLGDISKRGKNLQEQKERVGVNAKHRMLECAVMILAIVHVTQAATVATRQLSQAAVDLARARSTEQ